MADTLVDTNILLDVFAEDERWTEWSGREMANASDEGDIILSPVVYAELAVGYGQREALDEALLPWPIRREHLPWDAAFMAGKAFLSYRQAGGRRSSPLPDFFIGAHAAVRGYRLLTRDRGYYARFFPTLTIITPEAAS
jgi:predicted nucleic acid-binding protein